MNRSSSRDRSVPKSDLTSPALIKQVQKYPVLWDPRRPDYHDALKKFMLWKKIASLFWGATGKPG